MFLCGSDYCLVSLPTQCVLVAAALAETCSLVIFPGAEGLITISHCPVVARGEQGKRQPEAEVLKIVFLIQWWLYHARSV